MWKEQHPTSHAFLKLYSTNFWTYLKQMQSAVCQQSFQPFQSQNLVSQIDNNETNNGPSYL